MTAVFAPGADGWCILPFDVALHYRRVLLREGWSRHQPAESHGKTDCRKLDREKFTLADRLVEIYYFKVLILKGG